MTAAKMSWRKAVPTTTTVLILLAPIGAIAQVPPAIRPPVEQLDRPRDLPLIAPQPRVAPKPPDITTPLPQPAAPAAPVLSQGVRVVARAFRFTGNTVVSDADLQLLAMPFTGRELGNAELEELRRLVTRRYVDAGYINSGAVIPDQDVTDGIITLEIVEGRLSEIVVGGNNRFRTGYLRDRLALGAGPVLNVNRLQERMQLLLQDPQIGRIAAELAPGTERGDAVLRADVTGMPPMIAGLMVSNDRSPAVGANQAEILFGTRNLLGHGETLTMRSALTEGVNDYFVGLSVPLSARGLLLHVRHQQTRSRVVEAPFDQLDISARSTSSDIALAHPLIEHPQHSLAASALLTRRRTQSFFFGQPSPFVPGAPDGRTKIVAVRLGLDWLHRSMEHVAAARALFSIGLDALGATVVHGVPDSRFTALLTQFQWIQQAFGGVGQIVLRAEGQFADSALLGPEKYSLGGIESVRGYRRDQIVRDSGAFGSVEYRHTIARLPLHGQAGAGEGLVRAAIFSDVGYARDRQGPNPPPRSLSSVGLGLRWEPTAGFDVQFYWGLALRDVSTSTRTAQDRGLHFRAAYSKAF